MNEPLPHGWAWATVGEVATEVRSGFASGKHNPSGDGIPHLRPMNVSRGSKISLQKVKYVSPDIDERRLYRGDILFNNTNSPALVGKTALFELDGEFAFSNHMTRVRTREMVPGFVAYQLHYAWMSGRLSPFINNHVNQASIAARVLASQIQIAVAPIREQGRIVEQIGATFTRLDAVETTLKSLIIGLSLLRSTILADAFYADRDLPSHWISTTIGEVAEVQLGRQRSPKHHTGKHMRPYLRAANVTWNGVSLDDIKEMNFTNSEFERYRLKRGDLLLNEASGTPNEVGKPVIWDGEIEECCFQNTLLRVRPREVNLDYLYWYCYFSASTGRFGVASRGVNIRHLGKRGLSRFPIPVAPCNEQTRIANDISTRFDQMESLQQSVEDARNRVAMLRRSVLAESFAGRLVPQDPDDEPASVLLERIAASRPAKPKRRRKARA
jgi:type I restriction enzyme S subunit